MIKQINKIYGLQVDDIAVIQKFPLDGHYWDQKPNDPNLEAYKKRLRDHFDISHDKECAYCGNSLYITSYPEIEHVAPKGVYPDYMYLPDNLVFACHFCNGFSKKGKKNTIDVVNADYRDCEFNIVHPNLHNPDDHYEWRDPNKFLFSGKTSQGKNSIALFHLEDTYQILGRVQQFAGKQFVLALGADDLVRRTLEYKI